MSEYQTVPLARLVPSPFNPRKFFDPVALAQLATSIAKQGVLQPILVRPIDGEFLQVVAGERRYRAALLAEQTEVSVRIKQMTDEEALEAAVVENLQRVDVTPMEEARGFQALIDADRGTYDIAMIAAKTGKPERYIAERLKLCDLIPGVQAALESGQILLGHALLIAKFGAAQQPKALLGAWHTSYRMGFPSELTVGGAVVATPDEMEDDELEGGEEQAWESAEDDEDDIMEDEEERPAAETSGEKKVYGTFPDRHHPKNIREFSIWLGREFLLVLADAPFDTHDRTLHPRGISECDSCPKRTGLNRLLFGDETPDACTDSVCYDEKRGEHLRRCIDQGMQKLSSKWNPTTEEVEAGVLSYRFYTLIEPAEGRERLSERERSRADEDGRFVECDEMTTGVFVDGTNAGTVVKVCTSLVCKVHPDQREASLRGNTSSFSYKAETPEERKAARAKELLEAKIKTQSAKQVYDTVLKNVPEKLQAPGLRFIASTLYARLPYNLYDALAAQLGEQAPKDRKKTEANIKSYIASLPFDQLPELIYSILLFPELHGYAQDGIGEHLKTAAALYSVDIKAIQKDVRKEHADAAEKKAKAQAKAKAIAAA